MAEATGGNIILDNVNTLNITAIVSKLQEAGAELELVKNKIQIRASKRIKAVDIKTLPYPGFPTDMQSVFGALLTTAKGTSVIVENINELKKMGAKVSIEGNIAIIKGVKRLHGADLDVTDLRGGAALCLSALVARGESKIKNVEYILRGYQNFDKKLQKLNANICLEK